MAKVSKVTLKMQAGTGNGTLYSTWTWTKEHTKEYQVRWYYATGNGVWFVGNDSTTKFKQSTYSVPANATKVKVRIKPISTTYKKKVKSGKTTKQVETKYWTADWSTDKEYNVLNLKPEMPSGVPSIEFNDAHTKFTASITINKTDSSVNAVKKVEFQIYDIDKQKVVKTLTDDSISAQGRAAVSYPMVAGHRYRVRCRTVDAQKDYSSYTDYAPAFPDAIWAKPLCPVDGIYWAEAKSSDTIEINWDRDDTVYADTYEVQYTTNKRYFDISPDNVKTITLDRSTGRDYQIITGLDSGYTYYFRLRVQGSHDNGYSDWSEITECILAKVPAAPTTWSLANTVIVGENAKLYWTHNAEDNSHQTWAIIQLTINGVDQKPILVKNSTDEDKRDKVREFTIPTSSYSQGATIQWKVKTCGVLISTGYPYNPSKDSDYIIVNYNGNAITTNQTIPEDYDFGPWSIVRTINLYDRPSLSIAILDHNSLQISNGELNSYPFYVEILAGSTTQKPIRYYLSIMAKESYSILDDDGTFKNVSEGDIIYSTFVDGPNSTTKITIDPSTCHLENNTEYKISATVAMNSGLVANAEEEFKMALENDEFEVNAEFTYDEEDLIAHIKPYAQTIQEPSDSEKQTIKNNLYSRISSILLQLQQNIEASAYPTYTQAHQLKVESIIDKMKVALSKTLEDFMLLYEPLVDVYIMCESEIEVIAESKSENFLGLLDILSRANAGSLVNYTNVCLSVYRRSFDGKFIEIESNIDGAASLNCVDPHPALDFARYRIIGVSKTTGKMVYYDMPPIEIGEKQIVIQWDEQWQNFMDTGEGETDVQPYSASVLKLPYNIDVSDSYSPDVRLVEYIGREHPVSYYGTQLGESSSWKVAIEKDDIEILYALRRLAVYQGDVYVREPSGSGYWANVVVSFSQEHCELIIPVTFAITRVEGGK